MLSSSSDHILGRAAILLGKPACCDHLTEGNSAVVRWYPLVPINAKPCPSQKVNAVLRKIPVLKTPARKHDLFLFDPSGDRQYHLRQRVVEPCGNPANGFVRPKILYYVLNHGAPIEHGWFTTFHLEPVEVVNVPIDRKLQLHPGLPFKTDLLAQADK